MTWLVLGLVVLAAAPFVAEAFRHTMNEITRDEAPGRFVELSQGVTHYRWIGPARGPVAVCVHGLTTPSVAYEALAGHLGRLGYRVLVYDLYGRGYSDRPPGRQDAAFFLRQLDDLLADQKIGNDITLIGYSMGGAIATAYAARDGARLRQLVLLAPAGMRANLGRAARLIRDVPGLGDWLALMVFPITHRRATAAERDLPSEVPDIVDHQQAELAYRGFVPAVTASLRGILARPMEAEHRAIAATPLPVLAIWGRDDRVVPVRAMGDLVQWNRRALQEVIDGAGHGLPYTHAEAVAHTIRDLADRPD